MSVDIYLAPSSDSGTLASRDPVLTLEDDGLEGVLYSIQEFTGAATPHDGPEVDGYGTNVFTGAALPALRDALLRALEKFRAGPEERTVWIGTEVKPEHRELYQQVSKDRLVAVTARLAELAQEAISTGQSLVLVGD